MKSKRSFFNGVLFAAELKRLRPLSCMYCIGLCVILSLRFSGGETAAGLSREAGGRMIEEGWPALVIAAAVMAVVTAMVVFRHLYSHRDVAFICSLPLSRGAVYGSCFTAGLVSMLAADVFVTAVWAVVEAIHGILNAPVLLFLLAMLILLDLTFYGFAVLCAMLTGSVIVLPLVWLVLEVTASAVSLMIDGILRTLVFGFGESPLLSLRLSPLIWILECAPVYGPYFDGGPGMTLVTANVVTLAVYAALGIAFALLGLYLYRRRAMENAGEIVALPVLRPVFRWCMSLGCGLVFTWLYCMLRGNDTFCGTPAVTAWCVVFAALGAAVGGFGSEMLMKMTVRVFRQKQPGVILSAAILAAAIAGAKRSGSKEV